MKKVNPQTLQPHPAQPRSRQETLDAAENWLRSLRAEVEQSLQSGESLEGKIRAKLAQAITENPVKIAGNRIVQGHVRTQAAILAGLVEIPAVEIEDSIANVIDHGRSNALSVSAKASALRWAIRSIATDDRTQPGKREKGGLIIVGREQLISLAATLGNLAQPVDPPANESASAFLDYLDRWTRRNGSWVRNHCPRASLTSKLDSLFLDGRTGEQGLGLAETNAVIRSLGIGPTLRYQGPESPLNRDAALEFLAADKSLLACDLLRLATNTPSTPAKKSPKDVKDTPENVSDQNSASPALNVDTVLEWVKDASLEDAKALFQGILKLHPGVKRKKA